MARWAGNGWRRPAASRGRGRERGRRPSGRNRDAAGPGTLGRCRERQQQCAAHAADAMARHCSRHSLAPLCEIGPKDNIIIRVKITGALPAALYKQVPLRCGHRRVALRRVGGAVGAEMIAALLFINQKGEVIIHRTYRDNFSRTVADSFRTQASHAPQTASLAKRPSRAGRAPGVWRPHPRRLIDAALSPAPRRRLSRTRRPDATP